ncbi:MAG: hypothetical protein OK436_03145 [Thaumarchaeota archaeon]|nr:hypothetical protein [Nitrososphaerota archaeon]
MGKKKYHRRGTMTPVRVLKAILIFGPVAGKAIAAYQSAGGGMNGFSRGVIPAITTSYTGINSNDGNFYSRELLWGWGPVAAVAIASKLGLFRYLRF